MSSDDQPVPVIPTLRDKSFKLSSSDHTQLPQILKEGASLKKSKSADERSHKLEQNQQLSQTTQQSSQTPQSNQTHPSSRSQQQSHKVLNQGNNSANSSPVKIEIQQGGHSHKEVVNGSNGNNGANGSNETNGTNVMSTNECAEEQLDKSLFGVLYRHRYKIIAVLVVLLILLVVVMVLCTDTGKRTFGLNRTVTMGGKGSVKPDKAHSDNFRGSNEKNINNDNKNNNLERQLPSSKLNKMSNTQGDSNLMFPLTDNMKGNINAKHLSFSGNNVNSMNLASTDGNKRTQQNVENTNMNEDATSTTDATNTTDTTSTTYATNKTDTTSTHEENIMTVSNEELEAVLNDEFDSTVKTSDVNKELKLGMDIEGQLSMNKSSSNIDDLIDDSNIEPPKANKKNNGNSGNGNNSTNGNNMLKEYEKKHARPKTIDDDMSMLRNLKMESYGGADALDNKQTSQDEVKCDEILKSGRRCGNAPLSGKLKCRHHHVEPINALESS